MRACLINPFDRTVKMHEDNFEHQRLVYAAVGSYELGKLALTPGLRAYSDEMAPYRKDQAWFAFGNLPFPLAGRTLLLGIDDMGFHKDVPFVQASTMEQAIMWLDPALAQTMLPPTIDLRAVGTMEVPYVDTSILRVPV